MKPNWICSIDVESDGPVPGRNSMLSLGAAVFSPDGTLKDKLQINLELLPGAQPDPKTMAWWKDNEAAYQETRRSPLSVKDGMQYFAAWAQGWENAAKPARLYPAAYRAAYDGLFTFYYLLTFVPESTALLANGGAKMLDIQSYAAAALKLPYGGATKRNFPAHLFHGALPHSHVAVEDAVEQGILYFNLLKTVLK